MDFKAKLDALRNARGFTYKDLTEFLGLSEGKGGAKVQGWLNPKPSHPRLEDALLVAKKFGVPIEWLADDSMEMVPEPPAASPERLMIEKHIEILTESRAERVLAAAAEKTYTEAVEAAPISLDAVTHRRGKDDAKGKG